MPPEQSGNQRRRIVLIVYPDERQVAFGPPQDSGCPAYVTIQRVQEAPSKPVPIMPSPNIANTNLPATGTLPPR